MMIVQTDQLTVAYPGAEALSGVSVEVKAGDYVGLVGPNGSGKTTLVRAILGLLPTQKGQCRIFGQQPEDFRDWARVGYLPQKGLFLDARFPATVSEVIASGLLARRRFPRILLSKDRQEITDVLGLLNVADLADRSIGQLSGGQQQRVLLARALVHRPELLVLDEPTVALDPQTRDTFYSLLQHLNREHKTTIVLVSHDINTIGQYASKLLYLDRRVIFYGKFDEFCHSPVMREYFGTATQHVICHRH